MTPLASTRFTELVGCELPIQQAPIGFPSAEPELPLAVARAGGHGMLAAVMMAAAELRDRLGRLNEQTSAYGVNFIQPLATQEALEVAAEHAPLVELYLGEPVPDLVARFHEGGAIVSRQVISAAEARAAQEEGCDMIVARAIEAGGRTKGGIGLIPLLDSVLEAVEIPVVASGGIATGRGVAAALAAGADGVRMGTRFLAAEEARIHPDFLEALLAAGADDTVLTEEFSVGAPVSPHRVLRSALEEAQRFQGEVVGEMHVAGERVELPRFSAHNPAADATGHVPAMALYAGQSVGAVREVRPAGEIVRTLADDAARLLAGRASG